MNHEHFLNFMYPGFCFTVQALRLPHAKHKPHQYTQCRCAALFSLMRHYHNHVCLQSLQSKIFKATWMSPHSLIQELMLKYPMDVFLCLYQGTSTQWVLNV